MLAELTQAAVEAAKQGGSINIAIPTAVITSVLTGLAVKAPDILAKMRGKPKNGNGGPKPGMGETCKTHGEAIAVLNDFKADTKDAIEEIRGDIKTLLQRVPPR